MMGLNLLHCTLELEHKSRGLDVLKHHQVDWNYPRGL
jgi:hypothetical protein